MVILDDTNMLHLHVVLCNCEPILSHLIYVQPLRSEPEPYMEELSSQLRINWDYFKKPCFYSHPSTAAMATPDGWPQAQTKNIIRDMNVSLCLYGGHDFTVDGNGEMVDVILKDLSYELWLGVSKGVLHVNVVCSDTSIHTAVNLFGVNKAVTQFVCVNLATLI